MAVVNLDTDEAIVRAIQWSNENRHDIKKFLNGHAHFVGSEPGKQSLYVSACDDCPHPDGYLHVPTWHWIVETIPGGESEVEYEVLSPFQFETRYRQYLQKKEGRMDQGSLFDPQEMPGAMSPSSETQFKAENLKVAHNNKPLMPPRRFYLYRYDDPSGVSGVGIVAEGVWFASDDVAVVRWVTGKPTTVVHDQSIESVKAIHCHSGSTKILWLDDD